MTRFVDALPVADACTAFAIWRAARRGGATPRLWDFAPDRLPPHLMQWALVYRQRADGELVYGLAGEELTFLFGGNPRGRLVLDDAPTAERTARLRIIRKAMTSGLPLWFVGTLLIAKKEHVPTGRLLLPATIASGPAALVLYFPLPALPAKRPSLLGRARHDEGQVIWCTQADLVDDGVPRPEADAPGEP